MPKPTTYEYKGWLAPTDDLLSPVWTLRLSPILSLIPLLLSVYVFPGGRMHDSCVAFAAMMLTSTVWLALQITDFTLRRPAERSDVDDLPLTH